MENNRVVSPMLRKLHDDLQGGRVEALEAFWKNIEKNGSPLIEKIQGDDENYMVTLLWKATEPIDNVCTIGEMFGWDTDNTKLQQLLETNLWYRTWKKSGDAQSVYFFIVNEREGQEWDDFDFRMDPLNPNKYVCVEDEKYPDECYLALKEESYVSLPKFKENIWTIEKEDIPKGKLELFDDFESKSLNNKRRVWIYTPATYSDSNEPCGLAVFTDGWEYVHVSKAPIVFDNLISEGKIPPMCVVFIETNEDRDIELTCSDKFVNFLTEEILPWMHEKYNITRDREKNVIAGFSYGGLTANYIALKHPESFAKVFCHSGGLYWKAEDDENERGFILREYEEKEKLPLDFYVTFGEFEKEAEKHYQANQEFVKIMESKGYNFKYEEFMGGHTYMDVKINLANGLMYLLGDRNSSKNKGEKDMYKKNFIEIENQCDSLWGEGKLQAALDIIEQVSSEYPEEVSTINLYKALLNFNLGNIEKSVEALKDSLEKGIWYAKSSFKRAFEKEEYKEVLEAWEKLRVKAQAEAKVQWIIQTPENYGSDKKYPLFIALHGWGEDAKMFAKFWNSKKLQEEYILAMPQSSQVLSSSSFSWSNPEICHKDIKETYEKMVRDYAIDENNIIVGGFSEGAMRTLDIALNHNYIPVKGFIALCPDKPEIFEKENIKIATDNGIKGVILTGNKDGCYEEQKEIMNTFNEVGLKCEIVVKDNFGHWFPEDLDERIDNALDYIFS